MSKQFVKDIKQLQQLIMLMDSRIGNNHLSFKDKFMNGTHDATLTDIAFDEEGIIVKSEYFESGSIHIPYNDYVAWFSSTTI